MAINLGPAETAARETDKIAQRQEDPVPAGRGSDVQRHLYIIHNSDTAQPAPATVVERASPLRPSAGSQGMLDRTLQGQIGRMLRDVFSDVADEPVPERFVNLLEALAAKEKQP